MTEQVVVAPLLVALVTAVLTLLTRTNDTLQRVTSILGSVAYLVAVAVLFGRVVLPFGSEPRTLVYYVSDWAAPFGITLVADALSVFMLSIAALVALVALVYSVVSVDGFGQRLSYHPLYHFMVVGVSGSFLTADVFNLFVWFEVMLMSSYILVLFYSGPEHTRAALTYVVLNLIGSAVMLVAIGGLYATVGTLNMADMARRLAAPGEFGVAVLPVLGLSAVLFSVFALKAGLAPFQFWVPAAYRAAPAPVTAMLAGVVKKVGVYAIVRLYFTVFAAASVPVSLPGIAGDSFLAFFGPVFFVMATVSIVLGGVGAVGRPDLDGLLAHSSISQVGFIVLPLALAATAPTESVRVVAVTAALVYSFNHGLAQGGGRHRRVRAARGTGEPDAGARGSVPPRCAHTHRRPAAVGLLRETAGLPGRRGRVRRRHGGRGGLPRGRASRCDSHHRVLHPRVERRVLGRALGTGPRRHPQPVGPRRCRWRDRGRR